MVDVPAWIGQTDLAPYRCPVCSSMGTGRNMVEHIVEAHGGTDIDVPDDPRNPSFYDLDVFQGEVKEWAYRNFGGPPAQRGAALERFYETVRSLEGGVIDSQGAWRQEIMAAVIEVETAPKGAGGLGSVMGVSEELGEMAEAVSAMSAVVNITAAVGRLNHATLKGAQGIRHTPEEVEAMILDAAGDIMVYLADALNRKDLTMSGALEAAWGKVKHRDWLKNPMNAAEVATDG